MNEKLIQEGAWYYNVDRDEIVVDNLPYNKKIDGDDFFEIDELIIPLIKICNQKGYKTRYCCAGHIPHHELSEGKYYKQNTTDIPYIMFDKPYLFTNLPSMWHSEMPSINKDGPYVILRYNHKPNEFYSKQAKSSKNMELYVNIVKGIQELCRYFEKLPDASKMEVASEEWIKAYGESYNIIQEADLYGKRFDMSRIKSTALRTYLSKYKVLTTNGEEYRKATNKRIVVAGVSETQVILFEDDIKRAGLTDKELTFILWHELAHRLLNTSDEKACDDYALRQMDEATYRSAVAKTRRLIAELRKEHGITPSAEGKKKYGHRDLIKEDYEMEFDRLTKLRAIMEAEDSTATDEDEEKETNNDEEESTTPKKKAPSRFKKDDDDVDTDTSTEDEDGEVDGSDVGESDDTDSDDLSDFGNHGGDELPNNEYDPHEVETLNNLMASEADAMNEYLDAARSSKVDVLQRLYADIANEERFHMEQLIFAKSELTGEKYVPRDKDVRKEYEELLELGMDEDSAMATAVDKVGIKVQSEAKITDKDADDLDEDMKKLESDVEVLEEYAIQMELLRNICEYAYMTNDTQLINEMQLTSSSDSSFIMEEVASNVTMDKKYSRPINPIILALKLFKSFLVFVHNLAKNSQNLTTQIRFRLAKTRELIKKHGPEALFGEGVYMYLWSDTKNVVTFDDMAFYNNSLWTLSQMCVNNSKTTNQDMLNAAKNLPPFKIHDSAFNKKFNGPRPIVQMFQTAVFTKTKVVVNDNTREYIDKVFFGNVPEGSDPIKIDSRQQLDLVAYANGSNACIVFSYMVARIDIYAQYTQKILEGFKKMEGEPNGIFHTNQKLYLELTKYMEQAVKYYTKMIKIVTHDLNVCANLASGKVPNTEDQNKPQDQQQNP